MPAVQLPEGALVSFNFRNGIYGSGWIAGLGFDSSGSPLWIVRLRDFHHPSRVMQIYSSILVPDGLVERIA